MNDPGRTRFFVIQLLRIGGVALVVLALLILNGRIDLPQPAGWLMLAIGLLDTFLVPQVLARRWRSEDK